VFLGIERFLAGAWDDAIAELEAALELADETGERYSLALGHSVSSLIALHRGDLRRAEEAAARATGELSETGLRYRAHWARWAEALLLEASGATAKASAALADVWDRCARSGLAIEYPALGPDLVRLALAVDDQARARQVATAVADLSASNQVPWLTGTALRCQGLLERDPEILLAAVNAVARGSRPLELGLACEDAGAALAGTGRADTGVPLLERALGIYERLEAARDLDRTQARLRGLGVRHGRRGRRSRPQLGWESLTPTEERVVDLVAEGLTNPQIGERLYVSPRTVQTHLAHIFAKLGVSTRAQLGAQAAHQQAR
jgi:DNA-binding CsgD family transcriptional regulator